MSVVYNAGDTKLKRASCDRAAGIYCSAKREVPIRNPEMPVLDSTGLVKSASPSSDVVQWDNSSCSLYQHRCRRLPHDGSGRTLAHRPPVSA